MSINPSSLWFKDESLEITTRNYKGELVEHESSNVKLTSLEPGTLKNYAVTSDNQTIGTISNNLTVSFTLVNDITKGGYVELIFPMRIKTKEEFMPEEFASDDLLNTYLDS